MKTITGIMLFTALTSSVGLQQLLGNTADIKAYSMQIYMGPGTTSFGSTTYFTTYDGTTAWPKNDDNIISGELKPINVTSNVFRADYLSGTLYVDEYGTISITLPDTDSDGNGVLDILQYEKSVNANITGSTENHWTSPGVVSGDFSLSGTLSRNANSYTGNYSITYSIPGVGSALATGTWAVGYWSGTVNYENGELSTTVSSLDSDLVQTNLTGTGSYSSSNNDQVTLSSLSVGENGENYDLRTSILQRSGNQYSANVQLVDGGLGTSWADFENWHLVITDQNDWDSDGIPDLTDPKSEEDPSIPEFTPLGWAHWSLHPWYYNSGTWYYMKALGSSIYIYNYTTQQWQLMPE